MDRYSWKRSEELHEQALRRIPGGVNSNVRLGLPHVFFETGRGAWLWDVDGNDYVDYLLGQGPNFLGHANERVYRAVADACRHGTTYGAQHELELEAASLFCGAVPCAEMVRFALSGTEVVQAALRLARATTGRKKFVRFEGHYHGWLDNVLIAYEGNRAVPASAGQLASHLDDAVLVPWNDSAALRSVLERHEGEIAAVLMEPVMFNAGAIVPVPGYLQEVREACDAHGAVLIFDEVISGFRLGVGGAAEFYGVAPDLATYGKAVAGGWPVAALGGRGELMERFGTGEVNHSGTFNGSVMATAAIVATLELLADDPPYDRIRAHGEALIASLQELAIAHDVPLCVQGFPAAFHVSLGHQGVMRDYRDLRRQDAEGYARLSRRAAEHGVWLSARGNWYVSAAHGSRELEATVERMDAVLAG